MAAGTASRQKGADMWIDSACENSRVLSVEAFGDGAFGDEACGVGVFSVGVFNAEVFNFGCLKPDEPDEPELSTTSCD